LEGYFSTGLTIHDSGHVGPIQIKYVQNTNTKMQVTSDKPDPQTGAQMCMGISLEQHVTEVKYEMALFDGFGINQQIPKQ